MIKSGVAGIFSFSDDANIRKGVVESLYKNLSHRGRPIFISLQQGIVSTEPIRRAEVIIQFALKLLENPVLMKRRSIIVMDGFIFNRSFESLFSSIPKNLDGHFVICRYIRQKHRLEIYRDPIGLKPLFFTVWKNMFIFASERKALPTIKAERLLPGHRIILEHSDMSVERYFHQDIYPTTDKSISDIDKIMKTLEKLLIESIEHLAHKSVAIMFSGGLDSSLISWIAKDIIDVELFSVGLPDSSDIKWVRQATKLLKLNLNVRVIQPNDLDEYLKKTIYAIEENDTLKAIIGVPIYVTCEFIKDSGMQVAFAGQGADELFGGYAKYLNLKQNNINDVLRHDVQNLYHTNLERDNMIAMANSIDLRLPYLYPNLIKFVFSIPASLKVFKGERKFILRKLALRLGLPKEIALRPKKAIQYSSGVKKHLEKIAKKRGYTLSAYVNHIFNQIYGSQKPCSP